MKLEHKSVRESLWETRECLLNDYDKHIYLVYFVLDNSFPGIPNPREVVKTSVYNQIWADLGLPFGGDQIA